MDEKKIASYDEPSKELNLSPSDFEPVIRTKKVLQTTRVSIGFWEDVRRRFKKSKRALFSCAVLGLIILICSFGPILSGRSADDGTLKEKNLSPSFSHFFGTDELGRDIFTRVCKGGRVSLIIAIIGAAIDMSIGLIYGGISAYSGGRTDTIMMRIVEILSSIPYLITAILISLIFGKGIFSIIIAMTITGWCFTARLVRGQVLQIKNQDFILAAQALGTG